jgi:hypothetical protein
LHKAFDALIAIHSVKFELPNKKTTLFMKRLYIGILTAGLLAATVGACSLFETPDKAENDELLPNHEVYVDQAMNTVEQLWAEFVDKNQISNGRIRADSILGDSLEICGLGVEVDSTDVSGRTSTFFSFPKLIVSFNSFSCEVPGTIIREGTVTYQLIEGDQIGDKNSVVKFSFIDFKVTDLTTNQSATYNGDKIITNLSGGKLKDLGHCHGNYLDDIADYLHDDDGHEGHGDYDTDNCSCRLVQNVRASNFRITYGNGGEFVRNIAKTKVFFKLRFNNYRMYVFGDTTVGGHAKVGDWGVQPNGKTYFSIYEKPLVYESCYRRCKFINGVKIKKIVNGNEVTTFFGVNQNGNAQHNCSAYGQKTCVIDTNGDETCYIEPYN